MNESHTGSLERLDIVEASQPEPRPAPRWRNETVVRGTTRLLTRLLTLVVGVWLVILLLAGSPGRTFAFSNKVFEALSSNGVPAALLALLTPALAGLTGAVLVSQARRRAAEDERLLGLLPGTRRLLDAHRIGRAARLGQVVAVTGSAIACIAAAWLLRGANSVAPSPATAGAICVGLLLAAYPLLIGERLLANASASDLPEAADLRALLLLAVIGLPGTAVLLMLLAAGLAQARLGLTAAAALGTIVAAELAVRALLRAFLPRQSEDTARAACHSLAATLLADGTRAGGLAGSIRRNLGIDFARSWALSFVRTALPPVVLGLAVLSWGLTGLVVVGPDQRAIVEHLGNPVAVLHAGLHLAWPWPITRVRMLDDGVTRETNLSGDGGPPPLRRALADDRIVPEADRLWQDAHTNERLFLIASATGDLQSFQAMGADIRLIWRIGASDADARHFAYSTTNPERLLVAIAGRALSDAFASETLDAVLGENRATLAANLTRTIQEGADREALGITLVAVVIEAMHPPSGAAAAFHAVQAAGIMAKISVTTEQGKAVAARAEAQTKALETTAAAIGSAAETRAAATVALIGFAADRQAARAGGGTFAFERYLSNLMTVSSRTSLTILDHRVAAPQAPTIDLRLSGASGPNGQ